MSISLERERRPPVSALTSLHPEFWGFMRKTFARELMRTTNSQKIAAATEVAKANAEISTLKSEIARLTVESASVAEKTAKIRITELEGELLQARKDHAKQITEAAILRCENGCPNSEAPKTIEDLKLALEQLAEMHDRIARDASFIKELQTELVQAKHTAEAHSTALKFAQASAAEAQERLANLETENRRLKESSLRRDSLLQQLIAIHEAEVATEGSER